MGRGGKGAEKGRGIGEEEAGAELPAHPPLHPRETRLQIEITARERTKVEGDRGKRQHLFNQRSELQPLMNSRFPGTPGQVWVERSQKTPASPCTPAPQLPLGRTKGGRAETFTLGDLKVCR